MNGIQLQVQSNDTAGNALDRIINSSDSREPIAQYLASVIKQYFIANGLPLQGPPGPQGNPGPPGPNPVVMVADRDAVLAYPTQEGLFLQTRSEGKMYFTENYQWTEISNKPA